ncbi:MAG: hypothetical protein NTW87_17180 [Planctomycetota bacterium]|nr:hypothetical protein [Planctomycetota bacterium]
MAQPGSVEKRAVAYLDVLGFRELLRTTPLAKLGAQYDRMVAQTEAQNRPFPLGVPVPTLFPEHPVNAPLCRRYVFSDSIILLSNTPAIVDCLKLLVYAWRFHQSLLASGFPTRGAVAYDDLYENPQTNVVLGKALTTAYELEQAQQWIGVAVDKSVEPLLYLVPPVIAQYRNLLDTVFWSYPVPLKDGRTVTLRTFNWRFNLIVEKGTKSLFRVSQEPSARAKVENTLAYAKAVIQSVAAYVTPMENVPVELRRYFVGAKKPPFDHGDEL